MYIYGALKVLLDNFILQLFPNINSVIPSIINNEIIASIIPIINTDQKANLIIKSLVLFQDI